MFARASVRGISLLEVLVSMGIVAVGLIGAISLMPLAGSAAATAKLETRKGQMGFAAIDQFHTRGMNDPRSYVSAAGARWVDPINPYVGAQALQSAYCIDPLYVMTRGDKTFPEKSRGLASMQRVSLRSPFSAAALTLRQAQDIFEERDQLDFQRPADKTLPITQQYDTSGAQILRRRTESKAFSWFATLVRPNAAFPEQYRLSIAVCYNRIIPAAADPPTEYGLYATPLGSGFGGGRWEITDLNQLLKAEPNLVSDTTPSVRPGEWLMLGQIITSPDSSTTQVFAWYRIVDVTPFNTTTNTLIVSLDGPDWPVGIAGGGQVTATIFPGSKLYQGVVAVYEKTVTLETTPLWEN